MLTTAAIGFFDHLYSYYYILFRKKSVNSSTKIYRGIHKHNGSLPNISDIPHAEAREYEGKVLKLQDYFHTYILVNVL